MYIGHVTRVLWNGIASDRFSVSNGVKQGGRSQSCVVLSVHGWAAGSVIAF